MSYYFSKTLNMPFALAVQHVTAALAAKGFGVQTAIDVQASMKKKFDVELRPYTILGARNPPFAHKMRLAENKIGTMLPCNVVVQEIGEDRVEVAAVDPVASMTATDNAALTPLADEVRQLLQQAVEAL